MNRPEVTPGTLHFPVGPFQVFVRPSFWIMTVLLGGLGSLSDVRWVACWVGVVFVSILWHELGHATLCRAFGSNAWIELLGMGGLTWHDRVVGRWREIAISIAGPGFGLLLGAAIFGLDLFWHPRGVVWRIIVRQALWVNIGWSLVNLLPVLPLDGGNVMASLLGPARPRLARSVAIGVAVAVVAYAVATQDRWIAVMFGYFAFMNWQGMSREKDLRAARPPPAEKDALARGWQALLSGDESDAKRLAHLALSGAQTPDEQNAARDLLAWVSLADDNPRAAMLHLEKVAPPERARRLTWALTLEGMDLFDRALPHAQAAFEVEPSETSATLLVRLLSKVGQHDEAERIANAYAWRSPAVRDTRLADVAQAKSDFVRAASLYESAFAASQRPIDAYNAACAHARAGNTAEGERWVLKALDAGFDDLDQLRTDPDLMQVVKAPAIQLRLAPRTELPN